MNHIYIHEMNTKTPSQQRSRDKRDRILASMDALLKQRPFAEITVADLAQAAQIPAATLYQRFHNSDVMGSVLLALYYQRMEEWAQRPPLPARASAPSLSGSLRDLAAGGWDQIQALGHVMRPAYLYSRLYPQRVGPDWVRLEQRARDGFRMFLAAYADQLPAQNLDHAASELAFVVNALMLGPLLHGDSPQWQAPDGRTAFISTVSTVIERFLACPRE
jgi:AcrR family transcriptional regulator